MQNFAKLLSLIYVSSEYFALILLSYFDISASFKFTEFSLEYSVLREATIKEFSMQLERITYSLLKSKDVLILV